MNAPYFANTNPANSTSQAATDIRKAEYLLWKRLHPDPDDDIEIISQSLSDLTGTRQSRIRNIIFAFERLQELPRLKARQEELYHLDLDRLITIDQTLSKLGEIDTEQCLLIDAELTTYLTPKRPNQKLPSHRNLRRKLRELIVRLDPTIAARDPRRKETYHLEPTGGEWAAVCLDVGLETAEIIDRNIRGVATEKDISLAQAAVELLTGEAEAKAKYAEYRSHISHEGALALMSGWTGVDFSTYSLDQEVRHVQNDAGRSAMDNVTRADPDRVWTVREVAEHVGIGGAGPVVVGTPEQVTDKIEQWFEDTDVDGLNVAFAISPGDFEDIADMLVPELVKRGRYKREYAKGTLREKLFGAGRAKLDDAHPASRYRVKRGAAAE